VDASGLDGIVGAWLRAGGGRPAGVTEITRALQGIGRDRTRMLSYLPL
jgi:hypothetical protein